VPSLFSTSDFFIPPTNRAEVTLLETHTHHHSTIVMMDVRGMGEHERYWSRIENGDQVHTFSNRAWGKQA
jgi:mRNA degradation ribonuclease J1/J2